MGRGARPKKVKAEKLWLFWAKARADLQRINRGMGRMGSVDKVNELIWGLLR